MTEPPGSLVPPSLLFQYSLPIAKQARVPRKTGRLLPRLSTAHRIPAFDVLDGAKAFADLRLTWNPGGLGVQLVVKDASQKPRWDRSNPGQSDGLQLWIDTRNTQSIHRASRFCHHFVLFPGSGDKSPAKIMQCPIARAREDAPIFADSEFLVQAEFNSRGLRMDAWFAASQLNGFDPQLNPRLGFFFLYRDRKLGEQFLALDHDFPFANDPSLWATLELEDG